MFNYSEKIKLIEQIIEEMESRNAWRSVAKLKEVIEDLTKLKDTEDTKIVGGVDG